MSVIESLEVRGFGNYKRAKVSFTPGLNLIVGRNSTGKTLLLEAIFVALYGEVVGVDKKLLVSRIEEAGRQLFIELSFRSPVSGNLVRIRRWGRLVVEKGKESYEKPRDAVLTVDGKSFILGEEEMRKRVSELMGLTMRGFLNLAYVRQGELTRILEPDKEEMDSIIGISVLRELREQLTALRGRLEKYKGEDVRTLMSAMKKDLDRSRERIGELEADVKKLEAEERELSERLLRVKSPDFLLLLSSIRERDGLWEKAREEESRVKTLLGQHGFSDLGELESALLSHMDNLRSLKRRLVELTVEWEAIERGLEEAKRRETRVRASLERAGVANVEGLEEALEHLRERVSLTHRLLELREKSRAELEGRRDLLLGQSLKIEEELKNHRRLLEEGVAVCPTCGQRVDAETLKPLAEEKGALLGKLRAELEGMSGDYEKCRSEVEKLRAELAEYEARARDLADVRKSVVEELAGLTPRDLEGRILELEKRSRELRERIEGLKGEEATVEERAKVLKSVEESARQAEERASRSRAGAAEVVAKVGELLERLGLRLSPGDAELRARVAEILPFSPEVVRAMEKGLEEKRAALLEKRETRDKELQRCAGIEKTLAILEQRVEEVRKVEDGIRKLDLGIERIREERLREISYEALSAYNSMTDQRMYRSIRLNPETYAVEALPLNIDAYIPARRVGGGHQTLIALAVRLALLKVMGGARLLILDEPTYGVDSENVPQLIGYIAEIAKRVSQVILVTHHGFGEEEASNVIRVTLDRDGSSIVQQG